MPVDEIAASSPAAEPSAPSAPELTVESFSREQREAWMKDGSVPTAKTADSPAADEKPDSSSKKPKSQEQKDQDNERRFQELTRHNKELKEQLEELKKGAKPAPPAEGKRDEPKKDSKDERPKRLSMEDFIAANPDKTWKDYEDYKDDYHEQLSHCKMGSATRGRRTRVQAGRKEAGQRHQRAHKRARGSG